jgi:FHA domain-containing protein
MELEPVAVALKFGFLGVLYVFLLWVARSGLTDLRRTAFPGGSETAAHPRAGRTTTSGGAPDAWLVVQKGGGLKRGTRFDLFGGVSLGRSGEADIALEDRYASGIHARVFPRKGSHWVEDMNSTNGTYLNAEPLNGEAELVDGDVIAIGDTELRYEPEGR